MTATTEKLGAHEVAAWLRRHPSFLQQFPDLALTLVVPREEGKASSLASYQLEVLRDKNRELNRRLHELFGNAQENERLAVRTHQLSLALMRQDSAAGTVQAMAASLAEDFNGDRVRLVLFHPVESILGHGLRVAEPDGGALELGDHRDRCRAPKLLLDVGRLRRRRRSAAGTGHGKALVVGGVTGRAALDPGDPVLPVDAVGAGGLDGVPQAVRQGGEHRRQVDELACHRRSPPFVSSRHGIRGCQTRASSPRSAPVAPLTLNGTE